MTFFASHIWVTDKNYVAGRNDTTTTENEEDREDLKGEGFKVTCEPDEHEVHEVGRNRLS